MQQSPVELIVRRQDIHIYTSDDVRQMSKTAAKLSFNWRNGCLSFPISWTPTLPYHLVLARPPTPLKTYVNR